MLRIRRKLFCFKPLFSLSSQLWQSLSIVVLQTGCVTCLALACVTGQGDASLSRRDVTRNGSSLKHAWADCTYVDVAMATKVSRVTWSHHVMDPLLRAHVAMVTVVSLVPQMTRSRTRRRSRWRRAAWGAGSAPSQVTCFRSTCFRPT